MGPLGLEHDLDTMHSMLVVAKAGVSYSRTLTDAYLKDTDNSAFLMAGIGLELKPALTAIEECIKKIEVMQGRAH